eukprot:6213398-Karenia_brevis.AAC.1
MCDRSDRKTTGSSGVVTEDGEFLGVVSSATDEETRQTVEAAAESARQASCSAQTIAETRQRNQVTAVQKYKKFYHEGDEPWPAIYTTHTECIDAMLHTANDTVDYDSVRYPEFAAKIEK